MSVGKTRNGGGRFQSKDGDKLWVKATKFVARHPIATSVTAAGAYVASLVPSIPSTTVVGAAAAVVTGTVVERVARNRWKNRGGSNQDRFSAE